MRASWLKRRGTRPSTTSHAWIADATEASCSPRAPGRAAGKEGGTSRVVGKAEEDRRVEPLVSRVVMSDVRPVPQFAVPRHEGLRARARSILVR